MRKHVRRTATVADPSPLKVALAACEALVPTNAHPRPNVRKAVVLAKFALAMVSR